MSEFKCPNCGTVIDEHLLASHVSSERAKKSVQKWGTSYMKSLSMLGVAARKAKKENENKTTI